ncbi:MAG TPA: hypothetical protein VMC02_09655 [Steroidobacteraceae bacterium]|nr:hypothetical protein [Steroidobacteraceae bacterium]
MTKPLRAGIAGAVVAALAFTAATSAADPAPRTPAVAGTNAIEQAMAEAAKLPDPVGSGPYPALKEEVASLPFHVVYRPADLARLGTLKLGVVAWGNGGCSADGASSRFHLLELASHGYLVIASGRILSGPGAPPQQPAPKPAPGEVPPPGTLASQLIVAIDWALEENARPGSAYHDRIDAHAIALSGWSCGGLQAIKMAADPRVRTLVLQNTGIFITPNSPMADVNLHKQTLRRVHSPTLYILGGPTDIAYANGMDDYRRLDQVPVAVANLLGVGHGGTYLAPNGGAVAQVAVSWLDWQLRGDKTAAARFVGTGCGLCRDKAWTFESRHLAP